MEFHRHTVTYVLVIETPLTVRITALENSTMKSFTAVVNITDARCKSVEYLCSTFRRGIKSRGGCSIQDTYLWDEGVIEVVLKFGDISTPHLTIRLLPIGDMKIATEFAIGYMGLARALAEKSEQLAEAKREIERLKSRLEQ